MATLPRATVRLDPTASAPGGGDNLACVLAPCASASPLTPRVYGSASALYADHGYSEGVEYAAMHIAGTGKPVLFVALPINTAGVISRSTSRGNTGSSVVTVTAGGDGILAEHDGVLRVVQGGTIGTDQIKLELSLDGGRSFESVRLGTSNSSALPYVNGTLAFAAGTLVAGDTVLEWHGSAPRHANADLATAFSALAADPRFFRSAFLCGDVADSTAMNAFVTVLNAYATAHDRNVYGRASAPDRLPLSAMSHAYARLTGAPALTFAEVGASGDTITRSTGSWLADGFRDGDTIAVTGSASNNVTGVVATVTDLVLTMGTTDLAAEVTSAATVLGSPTLTFAEVGATADTITRSRGSWLTDGFRVGDTITVLGTASNNVTGALAGVSATVLTMGTTDLAAESIGSTLVTITGGETKSAWMARIDSAFASVDGQPRIDISAGRGAFVSPFSGWDRRWSAATAASLREYNHDLHVATWRKDLGVTGFDLFDGNNELVEWDERVDGPAGLAARFTTFRTYANGPRGAFLALSLTRAGDGKLESLTHNMAVINAAMNVAQLASENAIGRSLILNQDGTASKESLAVIAAEVNAAEDNAMRTSRGEGPRLSSAVWTPDPADIYTVPEPVMHATLRLLINGTVHSVETVTRVVTAQ